jgi:hypothetical protein
VRLVFVAAIFCFCRHSIANVGLMRLLPQWRQIRIVLGPLRHGQTHGSKHGILFGFFQLTLLLLDALSLGFF